MQSALLRRRTIRTHTDMLVGLATIRSAPQSRAQRLGAPPPLILVGFNGFITKYPSTARPTNKEIMSDVSFGHCQAAGSLIFRPMLAKGKVMLRETF